MRLHRRTVLLAFLIVTGIALGLSDLSARHPDPWLTLTQMAHGLLAPDFSDVSGLAQATGLTLAFAFCGVGLGAFAGLALAPFYHRAAVRLPCIAARAVHELFWAILLMNVTGISPLTGVLAIGIPYSGIFAKVFAEYLDEAAPDADRALPPGLPAAIRLIWVRIPQCIPQMKAYTLYRLECGLRSSAVLGFIGLPTLGFQLETYFRQAHYGEAVAVLAIFFALILPIRRWMIWRLVPVFLMASAVSLWFVQTPPMGAGAMSRFFADLVPAPLRTGAGWGDWLRRVFVDQAWPGAVDTLVLSQVALAGSAILAAVAFPLIVPAVAGRIGALLGHAILVLFRSIPEYMLAFIFLQIFGASMLPAILALALHNGAIIAHLLGRQADGLLHRPDAPRGLTLWAWDLFPRLSGNFWALCLYRWEIILRESAIMGLLGIGTLGFYIEKNVQELRLDRVVALLAVAVVLTYAIDRISRHLRQRMRLDGGQPLVWETEEARRGC
ncbi:ABC transporter permease [Pseudoruegeria sp. SK021]|uniref:PhnE/PtxC family ABC transporter permease n=1 Tax=Pseudoruegeria sp. SK021 TaxID=1933035 RepID=UPI000A23B450|nr:ABC transporter permease [Pseudoruegeria sp. SK021]OSP54397.1 ABC transporter permease [Pseudoruegeria sp. SK021]